MRYLLLFLSFSWQIYANYNLSICAIFKNEAPFLREWIEFHKLQGVEHFYLYNNGSVDDYLALLTPYIEASEVTLINWEETSLNGKDELWRKIQCSAYMNCINYFGSETQWLAVIDCDEFLFCPSGQKLPLFLKNYEDYGGLCVNWLCFGTSNVKRIPEGKLMIEMLTRCARSTDPDNQFLKTIIQPKYVSPKMNSCPEGCDHIFKCIKGKEIVNVNYKPQPYSMMTNFSSLDKIRINHYWTRTEDFFFQTKIKKKNQMGQFSSHTLFVKAYRYNRNYDSAILQFVAPLKEVMFNKKNQ